MSGDPVPYTTDPPAPAAPAPADAAYWQAQAATAIRALEAALAARDAAQAECARLTQMLARSIRMPPTDPQTRLDQLVQDAMGRSWRVVGHTYQWETATWMAHLRPAASNAGLEIWLAESDLLRVIHDG